jgi:hypothetical protein
MMRLKSPATYILLLIFICFAAGVLSVVLQPELEWIRHTNLPESTITPITILPSPTIASNDGMITILILGVDHIADLEGRLLAVWFLSFHPPEKQLSLIGLPIDMPIDEDQSSLQEAFNLWEPPEYGARFINQLGTFAPSPLRGYVVLDEHGFAVLLDYFGGIDLDDQHLDGSSVIGSLRLTYDSPQAALKLQARILDGLRDRVETIGTTPELTVLTSLSPIHAFTSPSPPELATLAIPLLPLDPSLITITRWEPNQ